MRTVAGSEPFAKNPLRSTKHGNCDGAASGRHSAPCPSASAIDVNVPHSWTVRLACSASFENAATPARVVATATPATIEMTRCCMCAYFPPICAGRRLALSAIDVEGARRSAVEADTERWAVFEDPRRRGRPHGQVRFLLSFGVCPG